MQLRLPRHARKAGVFACAVWSLFPAHAQETASTIQSESRLVLLDTVVTDKKGHFLPGLTAKDFRVFEDNKEQAITAFSLESAAADSDKKRYLAFFFDDSTIGSGQTFARQAAAKFADANAGPNRLMAVAEFSSSLTVTQNFTDDRERLKQALTNAHFGRGPTTPIAGAAGASLNNYSVRSALGALRIMVKSMSALPGRKTLIFVSGGYASTQESLDEINATVEACNRADVALYPIASALGENPMEASGGTADSPAATGNAGRRGAMRNGLPQDNTPEGMQQSLHSLASATGGFIIFNTNDLLGGFDRIGKDQEFYYILGYVPAKAAQPGACHALKVKLDKGGGTVRSRSSYCENKSLDVLSGTPAERDLENRMNANASPTVTGASLQSPFFYTAANTARVHATLEIPAGAIRFTKEKGKFHSVTNIVGIAWLPDGTVRARFSDSLKFDFEDKKQADAFSAKTFVYEKQFPIGPGQYSFKVVFSSAADQFGRLEIPLTIEPWEPSAFSLSGLALSHNVHPAPPPTPGIDAELVDDRVALVTGGYEIKPSASTVLKKADKTYLYAEIYEPALAKTGIQEKDVPAVGVKMEFLDPRTGQVKKDFGLMRLRLPPLNGKSAVPMGLILSAPELPSGPYILRVTAMDSTGKESVRTLNIQLE
jgi:VWFA-related protein